MVEESVVQPRMTYSGQTRRRVLLALALLGVAWILVERLRSAESRSSRSVERRPPIHAFEPAPSAPIDRGQREAVEPSHAARMARTFQVIDADLGLPVEFLARCEQPGVELLMPGIGRLLVAAPLESWKRGVPLRLGAPWYGHREVTVREASEGSIALVPSEHSTIHLTRGGVPVPATSVSLALPGGESLAAREAELVSYEADGSVVVRHAVPLGVQIGTALEDRVFGARVSPGSRLWVDLEEHGLVIRLQYPDGAPAPGIGVTLVQETAPSRALGAAAGITDDHGLLVLPSPTAGPATLRLDSNRVRFSPSDRQAHGVRAAFRTVEISGRRIDERTPLDIEVTSAVNRIRFLDADSSKPVEGTGVLSMRVHPPGRDPVDVVIHSDVLHEGWMDFPDGFRKEDREPDPDTAAIVSVAGYEPLVLPRDAYPFGWSLPPGLSFPLTPVRRPRWLHVLSLGVPLDVDVVSVHADGELLFAGGLSPDLSYGPFRATGEAVRVKSASRGDLGVATADPRWEGDYVLNVGSDWGALEVRSSEGAMPPLVCVTASRGLLRQVLGDGTRALFDPVPAGTYLVGPEEWVLQRSAMPGAFEDDGAVVVPGRTTIVQADPTWSSPGEQRGRVIIAPGAGMPRLLPAYATPVVAPVLRDSLHEIWVSPDGSYEIDSQDPVPTALLAVEGWGETLRVRAVFPPGGVFRLDEVIVELRTDGDDAGAVFDVSYVHDRTWAEVPTLDPLRRMDFPVEVGGTVSFAVHRRAGQIDLRRRSDGAVRSFRLSGSAHQVVDLEELFEAGESGEVR